jgi:DNA-binding MarR family transcriptional regulator
MDNQLVNLVNLWHTYEKENDHASIEGFARLYLAKLENSQTVWHNNNLESQIPIDALPIISHVGKLFGRITRFGQMYFKKALSHMNLSSSIDFEYLRLLNDYESIKKSELINLSISDFTTGIEVIKRLVKNAYAEEFPDTEDKRSKRLKITEKGKEMLGQIFVQVKKLGPIHFGALSDDEIRLLLQILKKLDTHHSSILKESRNMDLDQLLERATKKN